MFNTWKIFLAHFGKVNFFFFFFFFLHWKCVFILTIKLAQGIPVTGDKQTKHFLNFKQFCVKYFYYHKINDHKINEKVKNE